MVAWLPLEEAVVVFGVGAAVEVRRWGRWSGADERGSATGHSDLREIDDIAIAGTLPPLFVLR